MHGGAVDLKKIVVQRLIYYWMLYENFEWCCI